MPNHVTHEFTVENITWQGIEIEVTHESEKWGSIDHIVIRSVNPKNARIPVTETGYRSHFLPIGSLEEQGITAKELVLIWLEEESQTTKWKQYVEASRQGSLFDF